MPDLVLQKPLEKSWIRYIHQRINQNKNFLSFISGPTGSGKSFCSLKIGEDLDPTFNIKRVVFTGIELMELINKGNLKSGSVIVFEEVGVELSNKNWQSTINKMINYLVQTFRHRNFILIMNAPYMDFVDSSTRKLFHAELQSMSIDRKKNQVILKPQLIQYNGRISKFYYKYLRCITKNGVLPVKSWRVNKPSPELIAKYEKKKREYTDNLNINILKDLKEARKKGRKITCKQCGHRWSPRSEMPNRCARCRKNPYVKPNDENDENL